MPSPLWLIDTSAFLRLFVQNDPQQAIIRSAAQKITDRGEELLFTPQVARESWSVLTRPKQAGGFELLPSDAAQFIDIASRTLRFMPDTPSIYTRWLELVTRYGVSGRQVHDAYHVAAMISHGINRVLTLDDRDFKRYPEITVALPGEI